MKTSHRIVIGLGALALVLAMFAVAYANDCPVGAKSCKIVTITDIEEKTLTDPGQIFDQATWANRSGMIGLADAWRKKISESPSGIVKPDPKVPGSK